MPVSLPEIKGREDAQNAAMAILGAIASGEIDLDTGDRVMSLITSVAALHAKDSEIDAEDMAAKIRFFAGKIEESVTGGTDSCTVEVSDPSCGVSS